MAEQTKAVAELVRADIGRQVRYEDPETNSVLEGPLKPMTHLEEVTQFVVARFMAFDRSDDDAVVSMPSYSYRPFSLTRGIGSRAGAPLGRRESRRKGRSTTSAGTAASAEGS